MSQDLRKLEKRVEDINITPAGLNDGNYEGFEGMNYEQIRQPYNPNHVGRNNSDKERKNSKRPDES